MLLALARTVIQHTIRNTRIHCAGKHAELSSVRAGGTYSNHGASEGSILPPVGTETLPEAVLTGDAV
jgi:hypothetical protein